MLPALASTADATAYGLSVTDAALKRASTRLREFVGQQISSGTSSVVLRGSLVRLPQRPVTSITSVTDSDGVVLSADDYALSGGGVLQLPRHDEWTVVYAHGWALAAGETPSAVPDGVVELVCTIAARLTSTDPALAAGVTQEQTGSQSQTLGWDAWKGLSGLTAEEKVRARGLFPRVPVTRVMVP